MVTEGLLVYLPREEVGKLAEDLAACSNVRWWVISLASPGLLTMIQQEAERNLRSAHTPFQFGQAEGPGFFTSHGWEVEDVHSLLKIVEGVILPVLMV